MSDYLEKLREGDSIEIETIKLTQAEYDKVKLLYERDPMNHSMSFGNYVHVLMPRIQYIRDMAK